jgi:hypothetical protein
LQVLTPQRHLLLFLPEAPLQRQLLLLLPFERALQCQQLLSRRCRGHLARGVRLEPLARLTGAPLLRLLDGCQDGRLLLLLGDLRQSVDNLLLALLLRLGNPCAFGGERLLNRLPLPLRGLRLHLLHSLCAERQRRSHLGAGGRSLWLRRLVHFAVHAAASWRTTNEPHMLRTAGLLVHVAYIIKTGTSDPSGSGAPRQTGQERDVVEALGSPTTSTRRGSLTRARFWLRPSASPC